MMDFADLILELFLAAQTTVPGDGLAWEHGTLDRVQRAGGTVESFPGGSRLYGFAAASGLAHQLDGVVGVHGADVILELKAHSSAMPKNELLRYKAATDDFCLGLGHDLPRRPIYRIFGGPGSVSRGMQRYAAASGIAIVEGDRWPATLLASDRVAWPVELGGPSGSERRLLASLVRPMQDVLKPVPGGYFTAAGRPEASVDGILDLQTEWSARLWSVIDTGLRDSEAVLGRWAA